MMQLNRSIKHVTVSNILIGIVVVLLLLFAVFPFFWMVISSLKAPAEIFADQPTLLPDELYLEGYRSLFAPGSNFGRSMVNSFIVAGGTAFFAGLFATMAAYSFSKFRFPGNRPISFSLFVTQMFPHASILVPLYMLFRTLQLYDSLSALIIANLAFAVPVAIWLLIGFFDSISDEIIDAAKIDGASRIGVLYRIIIPMSVNGILATSMYIFISTWSELLFAVTFTSSDIHATLPVTLSSFRGQYGVDWAGLLAASTMTALPVAILFLLLQRFFIEGITAGATKG